MKVYPTGKEEGTMIDPSQKVTPSGEEKPTNKISLMMSPSSS